MRDSSYEPEQRERDEPNRMTKLNGFMCIAINIFVDQYQVKMLIRLWT